MEAEKIESDSDLSMIPFFRLFQHIKVFIQFLFVEKSGSVNPLKLFPVLIGSPVCSGYLHQLEGLDESGMRDMWPATKIRKLTIIIERNGSVFQSRDEFRLVGLFFIEVFGFALDHFFPFEGIFGLDDFSHLFFNLGKIILGNRLHIDIVIKPVFHHGTDGQLCVFINPQNRLGHHMGSTVPHDLEPFGIAGGDKPNAGIRFNVRMDIGLYAVKFHGDAVACKTVGYALCHIQA